MIAPTLSIGGTSKEVLREQFDAAFVAVSVAIDKVKAIEPHARDYPKADTLNFARREHASMLTRLLTVKDEIMATWEAMEDQKV